MAFAAGEWGRVDGEHHDDRRLVDLDARQWVGGFRTGNGLANVDSLDAGNGQDISGFANRLVHALQAFKGIKPGNFGLLERSIELYNSNLISKTKRAAKHPGDGQTAEVVAVVQVGDQDLQCAGRVTRGCRNMLHDRLEKRTEISGGVFKRIFCDAGPGIGVEDRKIELILRGVKVDKEIVQLVDDFLDTGIRPIDLIDHGNGR